MAGLAFDFLPAGFRGILFAALVAALMSTLDSVLNGASSLVVNDFLKRTGIERDEKKLLIYGRVMVIIFMIIAGLWAPVIFRFEGIVEYFQSFLGHITMAVVVIYLGGLFWKRATAAAAFYTLLIGAPLGFVAFIANEIFGFYELQFLYACGILLLISVIIFGGITLLSKAPQQTCTEKYTWSKQEWKKESEALYRKKWRENYRLWALVLTLVTLFLIIIFA